MHNLILLEASLYAVILFSVSTLVYLYVKKNPNTPLRQCFRSILIESGQIRLAKKCRLYSKQKNRLLKKILFISSWPPWRTWKLKKEFPALQKVHPVFKAWNFYNFSFLWVVHFSWTRIRMDTIESRSGSEERLKDFTASRVSPFSSLEQKYERPGKMSPIRGGGKRITVYNACHREIVLI